MPERLEKIPIRRPSTFGNPAVVGKYALRPEALRPRLSTGLPLSIFFICHYENFAAAAGKVNSSTFRRPMTHVTVYCSDKLGCLPFLADSWQRKLSVAAIASSIPRRYHERECSLIQASGSGC